MEVRFSSCLREFCDIFTSKRKVWNRQTHRTKSTANYLPFGKCNNFLFFCVPVSFICFAARQTLGERQFVGKCQCSNGVEKRIQFAVLFRSLVPKHKANASERGEVVDRLNFASAKADFLRKKGTNPSSLRRSQWTVAPQTAQTDSDHRLARYFRFEQTSPARLRRANK